jgi:hypothetical protein
VKVKITLILFVFVAFACSKDKSYSKKLMKGEVWTVEHLTVDGENYGILGSWQITQDVNIYESVPTANWHNSTDTSAFQWQFRNKGKTFELSASDTCCITALNPIDLQNFFLSGEYQVQKHMKKYMEFTSSNTLGFTGQVVEIHIRRKN